MNSRQLEYVALLSELKSFSSVAEKMGISQPALSKQILNLESEIGVKLFERTTPLTLTPAGRAFTKEVKELLYRQEQLIHSMEKYKSGEKGELVIGITPFRSSYMLSTILSEIREEFPGVSVILREHNSDDLRKGVIEGKFDFAIVNLPVDESLLDVRLLEPDKLVLAVPEKLLSKLPKSTGNTVDFSECRELPFAVVGESQEMRRLFDRLCREADFIPNVAVEAVGLTTVWSVVQSGVAATILPMQFISSRYNRDVRIYKINGVRPERQPIIVTRKGQYISEVAKRAISILANK